MTRPTKTKPAPIPAAVSTKDLAEILGVTTQRVEQLAVSDAAFKNDSWKTHGVFSEPSRNSPPSAVHTMSSLQIAEITGKNHADVIRDIRNTLEQAEIGLSKFAGNFREALKFQESYKDAFERWRGGMSFSLSENNKSPIPPCLVFPTCRCLSIGPHSQPRGYHPRSGTPPEI